MGIGKARQHKPARKQAGMRNGPVMHRPRAVDPPRHRLVAERKLDAVNRPSLHAVTVATRTRARRHRGWTGVSRRHTFGRPSPGKSSRRLAGALTVKSRVGAGGLEAAEPKGFHRAERARGPHAV